MTVDYPLPRKIITQADRDRGNEPRPYLPESVIQKLKSPTDAMYFDGTALRALSIIRWIDQYKPWHVSSSTYYPPSRRIMIPVMGGLKSANEGQWIIRQITLFSVIDDETFRQSYCEVRGGEE